MLPEQNRAARGRTARAHTLAVWRLGRIGSARAAATVAREGVEGKAGASCAEVQAWHDRAMTPVNITGDDAADALLSSDPLALLIGMLLDQQVTMEVAFAGPYKLQERLGGLDAEAIATRDAEEFVEICRERPAIHRYPAAMAARIQALCADLIQRWDGQAETIWTKGAPDGAEVLRRLKSLPGFGPQKAAIFLALLGKQLGVEPAGWREAAGPYGEAGSCRSVADVTDAETLARVRASKQAVKRGAKAPGGRKP